MEKVKPFLTAKEYMELMNLDKDTVYKQGERGNIEGYIRVGRSVRILNPLYKLEREGNAEE